MKQSAQKYIDDYMNFNRTKLLIFIIVACLAEAANSIVPTWEKVEHGITFSLKQIFPEQVKAFYIGRGFTTEQIKPYAATCIYTTVLRNDNAPGRIHFIRNNWSINSQGISQNIKTNADWLKLFKQVKPSALIAFRLAQIPEEQEYEPNGDWNQGMLSVNLPIGSKFDITIRWDIKGKPYELTLQEISCVEQPTN